MANHFSDLPVKNVSSGCCFNTKKDEKKLESNWKDSFLSQTEEIQDFKRNLNSNIVCIRGLSEDEDSLEDTSEVVARLLRSKLNIELTPKDFIACNRILNVDRSFPRDIVIRFYSARMRNIVLQKGLENQDLNFFICA